MAFRIMNLIVTGSFLCLNLIGQTAISPTYEAVANAAVAGGQYQFSGPGVIVFTAPIAFAANTTLDANGHNVVFTGNGASSLIRLETNTPLTLKGLMLADGTATGSHSPAKGGAGGAILNLGRRFNDRQLYLQQQRRCGRNEPAGICFWSNACEPPGGGRCWRSDLANRWTFSDPQ